MDGIVFTDFNKHVHCLQFQMIEGEHLVGYVKGPDGYLYVISNLDRIWVSTNAKAPNVDFVDITDLLNER